MADPLAWDLETHLIGPGNVAPKPVCLTMADDDGSVLISNGDPDFEEALAYILRERLSIGHNIAFDMACVAGHHPRLAPEIFRAYAEDRVTDTRIREKLIVLSSTGDLDGMVLPDGSTAKRKYHLADLERRYLSVDRSAEKEGAEDIWRLNYSALDGMPSKDYPDEARSYALEDAVGTWRVAQEQEKTAPYRSLLSQFFQARADFALYLQTCWGIAIDRAMVRKLILELGERFHESHYPHLVELGILRPSKPARPHIRQVAKAMEVLSLKSPPADWAPFEAQLRSAGIRFAQGEPCSVDTKNLHALVRSVCESAALDISTTEKGNISFDAEQQERLRGLHPALDEYCQRQEIAKLVTTELPRIDALTVHPCYDVLKETGRTSSFGSRKGQTPLYPAVNIQQIDPRVRPCYVARPDHVLCSVDYDYLELVSLAQKCLDLFGSSVLADKINAGVDPHGFLGAQLCFALHAPFREACQKAGLSSTDEIYEAFRILKKADPTLYKHYRTFAKPTGLGYPGGLGIETFITYARTTYGLDLVQIAGSKEQAILLAQHLKELWLQTYPEMRAYFQWVSSECKDVEWSSAQDERYTYISPRGMIRANCSYTAATNGAALQTPSAEGAKEALWRLAKACYDPSEQSSLYGCKPVAFIHDEVIVELPIDEYLHERAHEVADLMIEGMRTILDKVKVGAQPALMLRWYDDAEPVYVEGRLQIWTPKP